MVDREITKLCGIEKEDKFKAITLIANDVSKMDVFFTVPDLEKASWVKMLLGRDI